MMDLTPLEVRKKKGDFRRQIRGYDPESVDDFLDLVADRMEQLVRDNAALLESSGRLEQQVSEYREREKALTEALVSAQQLREEMRAKAVKDAEAARSEAERDADQHRSQAAEEAERARREAREILERAQAEARAELENARNAAEAEAARIRAEIESTRDRESETIRTLQERRALLLDSYRSLLEREMAELSTLPAVAPRGEPAEAPEADAFEAPVAAFETEAVAGPAGAAVAEVPEEAEALPEMSADLAALIEAAESDVDDLAWPEPADEEIVVEDQVVVEAAPEVAEVAGLLGTADAIDDAVDARLFAPDGAADADELLLEGVEEATAGQPPDAGTGVAEEDSPNDVVLEEVQDDDAWLSSLVDGESDEPGSPAPVAEASPAKRPAWEQEEIDDASDEDFIDNLIASAGVAPLMGGTNDGAGVEPPSFLDGPEETFAAADGDEVVTELELEAEPEPEEIELLDEEPIIEVAAARTALEVAPQADDTSPDESESDVADANAPRAEVDPLDSIDVLDGDEGFDALFGDGDDAPADFDFDAALVSATGFGGPPDPARTDSDNAFELGIELDDTTSPLDLGRGGAGPFGSLDDLGFGGSRNGFSPSARGELTLRPLSPEEEAPDLPPESRQRDESDDDMFSTMFRGRE